MWCIKQISDVISSSRLQNIVCAPRKTVEWRCVWYHTRFDRNRIIDTQKKANIERFLINKII